MASEHALFSALSGDSISGQSRFANPYADVASRYAPRTFRDALTLCEHLYCNDGSYRAASEKIVNYFITKLRYSGQADEEIEKFKDIFEEKFCAEERLTEVGLDYSIYGNAFASVLRPFVRVLKCRRCQFERTNDKRAGRGRLRRARGRLPRPARIRPGRDADRPPRTL